MEHPVLEHCGSALLSGLAQETCNAAACSLLASLRGSDRHTLRSLSGRLGQGANIQWTSDADLFSMVSAQHFRINVHTHGVRKRHLQSPANVSHVLYDFISSLRVETRRPIQRRSYDQTTLAQMVAPLHIATVSQWSRYYNGETGGEPCLIPHPHAGSSLTPAASLNAFNSSSAA